MNAYEAKIAACKAPKDYAKSRKIVDALVKGCQREMTSIEIADRLNEVNIKTITGAEWTPNNVQMALLFIAQQKEANNLVRVFNRMQANGELSAEDYDLLHSRCPSLNTKH